MMNARALVGAVLLLATSTVAVDHPATPASAAARAFAPARNITAVAPRLADRTPPEIRVAAPTAGATVARTVAVTAAATDNVRVVGVQFLVDGRPIGAEDRARPFRLSWHSRTVANGSHRLTARDRKSTRLNSSHALLSRMPSSA